MREIPSTLLLGCLGGDESCWQELIRLTGGHLQRIARVNLRDPSLTDDVLQETYFKVFRNLHRLRDREKARSWIVQILVNECRMMNRKTKREDQSQGEESLSYVFAATGNSRGRAETREVLARLLYELPEIYREILVMREVEGMDYQDIAQALRVPIGTVRSRLARARAMWVAAAGEAVEEGQLLDLCLEGGDSVA